MNIEMQAVKYLDLVISKTDYLVPNINSIDREPSWDGVVEVYRKAGDVHSKSDLDLIVPIQVKGHKSNNLRKNQITYKVEYSDLQNYLNVGGTIFFVVYVDELGEKHKIYYAELLPFELKKIIHKNEIKKKKSKSITLKAFPHDKTAIANVFLGFARNMKKQRATIYSKDISLEDILKDGVAPELSFGFSYVPKENVTPIDLVLNGNFYLYATMPFGVDLAVEHVDTVDATFLKIPKQVTVNGKLFYESYTITATKDKLEICFGKSTKHTMNRKNPDEQTFLFELNGTLSERIKDEEFLVELLTAKQFEVDGVVCPLNDISEDDFSTFGLDAKKEHLEWLKTVKRTLDKFDVNVELECDKLSDKDENNIRILKSAAIDGEDVTLNDTKGVFGVFNISNLSILVCILKKENGKYSICSFNDAPIKLKTDDEEGFPTSHFLLFDKELLKKCCNLNTKKMLQHLKSVPLSPYYFEKLTLFLLELLKVYDDSNSHKEELLEAIIDLSSWLIENDTTTPINILKLNYYQAIKRQRTLNDEEKNILYHIIEEKPQKEEVYVGAYLLLDNFEAASLHFNAMDKEMQEVFKNYPIYRFYNELKEENNR